MIMTIDEIKDMLLKEKEVHVRFTKKDGTPRDMRCTLHPDVAPFTGSTGNVQPEGMITVYDLDKEAWRTINTNINFELLS
tara:strand:- start:6668 stop:6907 length:240 start_codon:yes stop_codon:yes gene_type:complete